MEDKNQNSNPYAAPPQGQQPPTETNRYAANPYADFVVTELPPPPKSHKKLIIIVVALLTLIIIGVIVALTVSQSNKTNSSLTSTTLSVTVPEDWKFFESGFGFDAAIPIVWDVQPEATDNVGVQEQRSIGVGPADNGFVIGETINEAGELTPFSFMSVGTTKRTDEPGQAAFERLVTDKNETSQETYDSLGITKDTLVLKSAKRMINGVEWLEVYTEANELFKMDLYHWDNDRALTVSLISDNSQDLNAKYENYLLPMAAAIKKNE
ncbi:MAG: hypothetical protein ACR2FM_05910 [Candidatus Saccharimonadales bacterium]